MVQMQLDFPQPMTSEAPKPLPGMISKAQLCRHFDISNKTLRTTILTDHVLGAAGCVWERTDDNSHQPAIQFRQRLPPALTQMVYLMHNITSLHRQKGK